MARCSRNVPFDKSRGVPLSVPPRARVVSSRAWAFETHRQNSQKLLSFTAGLNPERRTRILNFSSTYSLGSERIEPMGLSLVALVEYLDRHDARETDSARTRRYPRQHQHHRGRRGGVPLLFASTLHTQPGAQRSLVQPARSLLAQRPAQSHSRSYGLQLRYAYLARGGR